MKPIPLAIAELKSALSGIGKVINPRTTLPVLQHVKVERTNDGWIALTGTDLDRFVTMRLEHPAEGPPCAVLVPFDQLQQLTKNCGRDERLLIDLTEQGPVIKFALADNLGETKVKPMPVSEFPETPRLKSEAIPMPSTLRTTIHEAMNCTSTDSTRYVLNGTFIDASNPKGFYVVGTDGKHLYSANSFTLPIKNSILIPNHKFLGWKEFNNDGEWQMKADDVNIQLSSRRWRFISRQIEGKYPDWRVTIPNPKDAKTHITFDPAKLEALTKLIQRIPCHDPDRYETIGLEWKQGQFLLLGKDKDNEPWTRVPIADAKGTGPDITIFISRHFLIKALSYGLNTISLIEYLAPLRFHNQGKQMIVMPLRPGGSETPPHKTAPLTQAGQLAKTPTPQPSPIPKPMINNPTSEGPAPNGPKTTLEECIDLSLAIRDKFNDGFNMLRDLGLKLKLANREQKLNAREMQSVRSTLRSLQGLKI
jgi:DNA polymerase III sliding clamp (beta) subunit (PCNA family)